ncbi:MAG: SPOR domain-containing protein [Candidatus Zixiibacteriota bacterium]|nr:MAG: SPOR domain-containing protein [candidate division Zixibacteria bacterium]
MARQLVILIILSLGLYQGAPAEELYGLIQRGKLQEARDSLSVYSNAATRDGRVIFCQSLVETDGVESARLMEAALNASVPGRYHELIYFRLAQYYLLAGNSNRLSELVGEYLSRWEGGRYESQMRRIGILVEQLSDDQEAAIRQADRYLLRTADGKDAQWGKIDKARALRESNKNHGANTLLRSLSREKSGEAVPLALYLLGVDAVERKRPDDAVFFYNLLREAYPSAVGLDDLVEQLGGLSDQVSSDSRAEAITGTYYSIQVGVFSSRGNARRQADKFKAYDHKIDIKSKTISGKKYRVVYIGRFDTFEAARQFKSQLETTHGEAYQVVAR